MSDGNNGKRKLASDHRVNPVQVASNKRGQGNVPSGRGAAVVKRKIRRRKNDAVMRTTHLVADILEDPTQLKDWDEEELRRGYRRNKAGTFSGRPPNVVPTACYQELTKRKIAEAQSLLRDNLVDAVKVLRDIMLSDFADEGARIKAADMFMQRVLGKVPDKVEMGVSLEEPKWLQAMREATVVEEADGMLIDAPSRVVK